MLYKRCPRARRRQDITGLDAIRAWAEDTGGRYKFTAVARSLEKSAGESIVTAQVSGDFPGSPIDLRYRFALMGGRDAALRIG